MKLLKSLFGISVLTVFGLAPIVAAAADKIVVYGASGKIGGIIVDEALDRGYEVVGVSRDPSKFTIDREGFSGVKGDVTSAESMKEIVMGAKGVIISVSGGGDTPETTIAPLSAAAAVEALTGVEDAPQVVQMGGASSIGVTREQAEADLPPFAATNPNMKNMLMGHFAVLENYRASDIPWTVLSPAMNIKGWGFQKITDGETSMPSYDTSTEGLVLNSEGKSEIWVRDLAKAAIDAIENATFVQQQFSVGYK